MLSAIILVSLRTSDQSWLSYGHYWRIEKQISVQGSSISNFCGIDISQSLDQECSSLSPHFLLSLGDKKHELTIRFLSVFFIYLLDTDHEKNQCRRAIHVAKLPVDYSSSFQCWRLWIHPYKSELVSVMAKDMVAWNDAKRLGYIHFL